MRDGKVQAGDEGQTSAEEPPIADTDDRPFFRKGEFLQFIRRLWASKNHRVGVPIGVADAVFVGTVHSSKGLEFPIVFVPFLAEKRFPFDPPHDFAPPPPGLAVDEEVDGEAAELEALFFVAVTRARDGLLVSVASEYGGKPATPSRLLTLLKPARADRLFTEERWESLHPSATADSPSDGRWEAGDALEEITYSAYDTFLKCPRRYLYRHVLNLPEPDDGRAYLAYVNACRKTLDWLEAAHRHGGLPTDCSEAEAVFAQQWAARGPVGHAHEAFYRVEALRCVRQEWERRSHTAPEAPWAGRAVAEIDGVRLTIPVEATAADGTTVRVGHRFFRPQKPKDDHLEPRFALLRLAMTQAAPGAQVIIEAHYPDNVVQLKPLRRDAEQRRIDEFRAALTRILAGDFLAEPAGEPDRVCPRCPYGLTCTG